MGENRREWQRAMQAEYEAARDDGRPLWFAAGCLIAAWRELPHHAEGRLTLANHTLALGLIVPLAYLQFAYAIGVATGHGAGYSMLALAGSQDPFLLTVQLRAVPALLVLWLLLGIGNLHLAWVLLDGDWSRVVKAGARLAAATLTLIIFMNTLLFDATSLLFQVAALTVELILILAIAMWQERNLPDIRTV